MMSVEGPFLSALIARLPDPKFNLAAYGVAFSFALVIEAPVIMMLSAATTLVRNTQSYYELRKFNIIMIIVLTLMMLLLVFPPVFYFIAEDLIGLPAEVSHLTHLAIIIMIPWPGAIGIRRFYQGILIRNNMTRRVAYGTVIRITTIVITATLLYSFTKLPGALLGAAALSTAVIFEAIASRIMAKRIISKIKSSSTDDNIKYNLNTKSITSFYFPLAITSLLTLGVQPFVTFFIGQSRLAIDSLAVMPVVTSFVFIFRGLGLSFQEVVVALLGEQKEGYQQLKIFAVRLAFILAGMLVIIAFTPLSDFWFKGVSGLTDYLADIASEPLMIMSFFPALTVLVCFQRGTLVSVKNTRPITYGTAIEFITIIVVLFIAIKYFDAIGAVAATVSFVLGRIAANLYLMPPTISSLKTD
jgi:progressive ankylosis protein